MEQKIFVLIGILNLAMLSALKAKDFIFVSISQRIVPALILAIQWSILPLPFPIRISIGFLLTGVCAKTFKITRPFFYNFSYSIN